MKKVLCCISASIITALSVNTCLAANVDDHPSVLRISSGLMDNPDKPLEMTVLNTSNKTVHLGELSLSHGAAFHGWKLSHDSCSGHALLPQQSCTYSISSSSHEAGNHVTVALSAAGLPGPVLKEIVIPFPKLKIEAAANGDTLILKDNATRTINITNTSPSISIPGLAYQLGNANFVANGVAISNSCGKLLGPSASCTLTLKTDKIAPALTGRATALNITANGNVLASLGVAFNDPEQLQFSVAPRQYPAFEDVVVTNTNADTATIKFIRMPQSTDMSFSDHPDATDPDTTPVCKFGLQLTTNQQCHIWLHAKTGALSLSPNNFQLKVTYTLADNKIVKEIDGDNRSVLYLGGTDANGKPLLAAYTGFSYQTFAALTGSSTATFPDGDSVLALATDANGTLYYGGNFSDIQNTQTQAETVLNHIGAWTGSDFIPLNNGIKVGVNDTVRALSYNPGSNVLYLGGDFNDNSPVPMNYVAAFYSGAIHLFDKNDEAFAVVNGPVYALANDGGSEVYIGGDFPIPNDPTFTNDILEADFSQSNPFANPMPILQQFIGVTTRALDIFDSNLYAGSDQTPYNNIQYFDGEKWSLFADSADEYRYSPQGPIYSELRVGKQVLVGGDFAELKENSKQQTIPDTQSFAIFNPDNNDYTGAWSPNTSAGASAGDPVVYSMIADNKSNLVYIAGHFDSIDDGISANNLAAYDPVHNSYVGISNSPFGAGAVKAMVIGSVVNIDNI